MPSVLNHRLWGSFPGSSLPLLLSAPLAKHLPPWEGHSASPFCLLSAHVVIDNIWQSEPICSCFYITSHMVSILASVCNSLCPARLPVHKTKAMKHHYRDPQPLLFSLSISVPSLSPNRWCRALIIFHYHFLNLVTSRVSDFHWSPAVLNPEG